MKKQLLLFIIILTQQLNLLAQTKLKTEIENLKKDPALKHAAWSICVMPANKDTVLFEYNSHQSLIPASTLKAITTGTALSILGADFKFETQLAHDGNIDPATGILKGNIYIVGGGDPSLDSKYFDQEKAGISLTDQWAQIIKEKGIKSIQGKVIGDANIFENNSIPSQWIWSDIGNYFGAGAYGLSFQDNAYNVYLKSGVEGTKTEILKTEPEIPQLKIDNQVIARGRTDSAYIYGAPYCFDRMMEGSIPPQKSSFIVKGSLPDPALFCAQSLSASLLKTGITISKEATTVKKLKEEGKFAPAKTALIHTHYSPSLEKIVYLCNIKSINLYAEHLLKYLSYKKNGLGTEQEGIQIITDYWKNKGIDIGGFVMTDACGLSRANLITTKTQTQILRQLATEKSFAAFHESLPLAGKSGSMHSMCKGTSAENNLCAKTGYITLVRAYTGYVKNKKGELLCFAVIANNYDCSPTQMRLKIEKLLSALPESY